MRQQTLYSLFVAGAGAGVGYLALREAPPANREGSTETTLSVLSVITEPTVGLIVSLAAIGAILTLARLA